MQSSLLSWNCLADKFLSHCTFIWDIFIFEVWYFLYPSYLKWKMIERKLIPNSGWVVQHMQLFRTLTNRRFFWILLLILFNTTRWRSNKQKNQLPDQGDNSKQASFSLILLLLFSSVQIINDLSPPHVHSSLRSRPLRMAPTHFPDFGMQIALDQNRNYIFPRVSPIIVWNTEKEYKI